MLQVVDEVDDALGAMRHLLLGLSEEVGLTIAGSAAVCAVGAAFIRGVG